MGKRSSTAVDVLVIGGGVVGASTALALSGNGVSVALLEAGTFAMPAGSSAGGARIYVPAAFPEVDYLSRGIRAHRRWREIEAQVGQPLLHPTGALSYGAFAGEQLPALAEAGVEFEELGADEVRRRFGVHLPAEKTIVFQPDAGVIDAGSAHAALISLARAAGTDMHEGEAVSRVRDDGQQLLVETASGRWSCRAVVVAAGPWSLGVLAGLGVHRELEATSQTVLHLDAARPPSRRSPALIDYDGEEPYSLWESDGRLKLAFHARGPVVHMDAPLPAPDHEIAARLREWASERYPDAEFATGETETCLYTNTPKERFVLERAGRIVIASACNGQGFQLAPRSGTTAAALALQALDSERVALV